MGPINYTAELPVTRTRTATPAPVAPPNIRELVITLFELGREITAVLNLDELLQKIPQLIARLTKFQAFAVYLLDPRGEELSIAYAVGYPDDVVWTLRVKVGRGAGRHRRRRRDSRSSSTTSTPIRATSRRCPGSNAELVVPLRRKGRVIGALNLLSDTKGQFTEIDEMLLRQFGAHVAVAIENARLFEHEREYTSTLETLSEIGREFGAILNLDELLTRIANLTRRVDRLPHLRHPAGQRAHRRARDEGRGALRRQDHRARASSSATASSATPRCTRSAVLVPDVSVDPRYIKVVDDARSELVIPLMLKDRCIGVFDLESPELDAFSKSHVDILTLLASQAAVAIENARLYETDPLQRSAAREGNPLRAARAGRAAAGGAAQADEGRRRRARASRRRASSAATSTTSSRPSRTASSSRSATCRARACRRRSTARLPASWCARARSAAATRRSASRRPAC